MTWKPSVSSAFERRQRWTRAGTQSYAVRGYRGVARNIGTRPEEYVKCYHVHKKQSAARECAEQLARSLNKSSETS